MSVQERLIGRHGALLVVDMQEKLLSHIPESPLLVANAVRLIRAARLLDLPVMATEQYPKGLGPTTHALAELLPHRPEKTTFHCCAVPELVEQLHGRGIRHVTLAGIEAHVCVAQTAVELLAHGLPRAGSGRCRRLPEPHGLGVRPATPGARRHHRDHDRSRDVRVG